MKKYSFTLRILIGFWILVLITLACENTYDISRVEPEIEVQDTVITSPLTMRQVINLRSSYPWFAEASHDWIKLTRNRGQALKNDSIVFSCDENEHMDDRKGWIEVRLMDQFNQRIEVVQKGRGALITLPQSLVYFNRKGGEVIIEVITNLDWQPEASTKDGFTFTKVDNSHLKIVASENVTNEDKITTIKLFDKENTADASLSLIQKTTDQILFIALEEEKKDIVIMKEENQIEIPTTLNVDYECVPSASWINVSSAPKLAGEAVQDIKITAEVEQNQTGVERDGYLVIRNKGDLVEASDTLFISQRGKNQIIYVRPGAEGDGTSWQYAYGSIQDAMNASSNNGDMEIWVAAGEYQFESTLTWKAVNVYGGFSGDETKFKERDLKNKPVFLGGNFNFMNAWNNNGDYCWMDGIVFADCDNYENKGVGCFEIYKNHGFRNCEFRNIRHGNAIGYFNSCIMVNCVFSDMKSQRYLLRSDNTQLYNVTIVNGTSTGWNSNYFYNGSKLFNTLIWNVKILDGERDRALVIGGNVSAINCAIMNGINENGLIPTNCVELDSDNNGANGPNFVDPDVAAPNFMLSAGSACIDAGNSEYLNVSEDFIGNQRVNGRSVDIGAYEYVVE